MEPLFGSDFFRRLELVRARFLRGRDDRGGSLPSPIEAGEGVEFQDYRGYAPGDDPRYIDWNAFARLGRVFLKRFRREEGGGLVLAPDLSPSMAFGDPPKDRLARQILGAVGLLGVGAGARVRLLGGDSESFEGPKSVPSLLRALEGQGVEAAELPSLRPVHGQRRRQEIFLATDGLFGAQLEAFRQEMVWLRQEGHELVFIHVLEPGEREPPWQGPLRLRDAETGEVLSLDFGPGERERYAEAFADFVEGWKAFCKKHGVHYTLALSEGSLDEALGRLLNRAP